MTGEPFDALEALLPAYALNALEDEDRELVERAMEQNPRYRDQLGEYLAAVAQLAGLHQAVTPSAALRQRVFASRPPEPAPLVHSEAPVTAGGVAVKQRRRRSLGIPALWTVAAALMLAVVGIGSFSAFQYQELRGLRKEMETMAADAAQTEQRLVAQQALTYWMAQPNITTIAMRPETNNVIPISLPGASVSPRGMLMRAPSGETVLMVLNLPSPPKYYSYQGWVWDWSGNPHSLGVFETDANGFAQVLVDFPQEAARFQLLSVTVEPAGGSASPSNASVLTGILDDR